MLAENEMNRNIRAVIAGLLKFFPIPPKSCFTTTIANRHPRTACQNGKLAGTLNAISSPVRAAERSQTVCFLCVIALYAYSKSTLAATHTTDSSSALIPKM